MVTGLLFPGLCGEMRGSAGGEGVLITCMPLALRPLTLASLHCRGGARRVFTDQTDIGEGGWGNSWLALSACFGACLLACLLACLPACFTRFLACLLACSLFSPLVFKGDYDRNDSCGWGLGLGGECWRVAEKKRSRSYWT